MKEPITDHGLQNCRAKGSRTAQDRTLSVGFISEFERGKSTLLNALLGAEMLPSEVIPTTAAPTLIRWGAVPRAVVNFNDGTQKEVPVEELERYITMTTKQNAQMAAAVENAELYYPCPLCRNGVQLIDTPGLNCDERMTEIVEKVFPTLDAVVMVISVEIPFSECEAEFLREKLASSDMDRVIFVVNKIDLERRKDVRTKTLDTIRRRITENVLEGMALTYGRNSVEYQSASDQTGSIRVYGVSALDALKGRMNGDKALVEKSGFAEFEAALSEMLAEERGLPESCNG